MEKHVQNGTENEIRNRGNKFHKRKDFVLCFQLKRGMCGGKDCGSVLPLPTDAVNITASIAIAIAVAVVAAG